MTHGHHDPEENLPDWLRALRRQQDEAGGEEPPASPDSAEPDWLQEIRQRYRPSQPPSQPQADPDEDVAAGQAQWLDDTQPNTPVRLDEAAAAPDEDRSDQPENLAEAEPGAFASPFELAEAESEAFDDPAAREAHEEDPAPPAFFPWEEEQEQLASMPAFSADPDSLESEPSWLDSLRRGDDFPHEDKRSAAMLPEADADGPLAGLSDVLPASNLVGQINKTVEFSTRLEVTGSQRQHAAVLQELLQAEQEPPADSASRPLGNRLLGILGSLLLVIAVLVPLLRGSQSASRPDTALGPEVRSLFNSIDVLPAGAAVLLAFDLQPAQYGEMTPAVVAVVDHLLEKQAHLVLVSTSETGPALAEQFLQTHFGNTPLISTGKYTNLGYLAGGAAALRNLAYDPHGAGFARPNRSDVWQSSSLQPVEHLRDFALVLVLASDGEGVRLWIEQVASELPGGLYAVTSAQAQPLLRAYLQSNPGGLRGLLSGLQGAVVYERMRGDTGLGRQYWDAYSYGLGAMVLVILFGNLYSRLAQTSEPQPAKSGGSRGA